MIELWVSGIGVLAPGLNDWDHAIAIFDQRAAYRREPVALEAPALLNARERRRTSDTVRLALAVAEQCMSRIEIPANELAAVFGTSNSDGATVHHLLEALADPDGLVSPTLFHNSVHNAASGYWSIGVDSQLPATSIAAHDFTFGATLLKSAVQAASTGRPVLMVAYDMPYPEPLHSVRPLLDAFAVSLVLEPGRRHGSWAKLTVDWSSGAPAGETRPELAPLHALWKGNPAARALPLLEALASGYSHAVAIRYPSDGTLGLSVERC